MSTESSPSRGPIRRAFLTGVAVIVPLIITLIVLAIALNAVYDYLDAFSSVIVPVSPEVVLPVVGPVSRELAIEAATPVVFLAVILVIGLIVDSTRYGERAVDYVDYAVEQVPGVGSVYEGFRQMSDAMLDSGGNFQEVVLVEFPTEGTYSLAFVTGEAPESVVEPTGGEPVRTLFMPMAPNPVMGGHVVFVPTDRIVDVDLTVEQGIRALVTSGVALDEAADGEVPVEAPRAPASTDDDRSFDLTQYGVTPNSASDGDRADGGESAAADESTPDGSPSTDGPSPVDEERSSRSDRR